MRKGFLTAAGFSLFVAATYTSPALAAWGCGSQAYPGGHFRTYGFSTKSEASEVTLRLCSKLHNDCRIIGCSSKVDNEGQANARWPLTTSNQVRCGAGTDVKC
jgi:hypothetical protein